MTVTVGELLAIIAGSAGGLVSVVNAVAAGWGRDAAKRRSQQVNSKLDVIHDLTNSNLATVKAQLSTALARIERLEALLEQHQTAAAVSPETSQ